MVILPTIASIGFELSGYARGRAFTLQDIIPGADGLRIRKTRGCSEIVFASDG